MLLKYAKVRNVKTPVRGHATDAGMDFMCPELDDQFILDFEKQEANQGVLVNKTNQEIVIKPGQNACIPSGIKVEIPYGYMGQFADKSGIASKNDIIVGAKIVDTFYSGEVHVDLHNIGLKDFVIKSGMKLIQLILVPILSCDLIEVKEDQLYNWMKQDAHRGEGGFGSTGK